MKPADTLRRIRTARPDADAVSVTIRRLFPRRTHELRHTFISGTRECGINHELFMLRNGHSFDKDVKTSVIDRGYTDYSKEYILAEAEKFDYEL